MVVNRINTVLLVLFRVPCWQSLNHRQRDAANNIRFLFQFWEFQINALFKSENFSFNVVQEYKVYMES